MKKTALLTGAALCVCAAPYSAMAEQPIQLPEVSVGASPLETKSLVLDFEEETSRPYKDGGDFLRTLPGVSGSRMGGHGVDPVIRGQQQGRLNIVDDGLFVHGGCPNRMDPPSAFLSVEGNDTLIVEKGYTSVTNGPGGSGGSVRTEKQRPFFSADKPYNLRVSGGIDSNGQTRDVSVRGSVQMSDRAYGEAQAELREANNYEDGSGKKVRSGFSKRSGRVDFGFAPDPTQNLSIGVQYDKTTDALFAGSGMDAPLSELKALRAGYDHQVDMGLFTDVSLNAYVSGVDHIMDNFSLRPRTGMGMLTQSDTLIYGSQLKLEGADDTGSISLGLDVKVSGYEAVRFMGAQNNIYADANIQAYMWPDYQSNEFGLFGEKSYNLSQESALTVGLRYDYVYATADKSNLLSARNARTPNDLYRLYYGYQWEDQTEHNLGGLLRFDHDVNSELGLFTSLSRSVRTADATERSMAANNGNANLHWVGNPQIEPEKHHQFEFGANLNKETWGLSTTAFYNRVEDYILRDQAFGQDGILQTNGNADIYRNIDATLAGFEVAGRTSLTDRLNFSANVSYTYGQNEEDDTPLAQMPPLEFSTTLEYDFDEALVGVRVHGAGKQTRADLGNQNSGLDLENTGGFGVVDLYGQVFSVEPFDVSFGVSNVFDKTYSHHLNRGSSFDTEVTKVNEPGRSFFLRVNATF